MGKSTATKSVAESADWVKLVDDLVSKIKPYLDQFTLPTLAHQLGLKPSDSRSFPPLKTQGSFVKMREKAIHRHPLGMVVTEAWGLARSGEWLMVKISTTQIDEDDPISVFEVKLATPSTAEVLNNFGPTQVWTFLRVMILGWRIALNEKSRRLRKLEEEYRKVSVPVYGLIYPVPQGVPPTSREDFTMPSLAGKVWNCAACLKEMMSKADAGAVCGNHAAQAKQARVALRHLQYYLRTRLTWGEGRAR